MKLADFLALCDYAGAIDLYYYENPEPIYPFLFDSVQHLEEHLRRNKNKNNNLPTMESIVVCFQCDNIGVLTIELENACV